MSTPSADWTQWSGQWRAPHAHAPAIPDLRALIRHERARARRVARAESALAAVLVVGIVAAAAHAPTPDDLLRAGTSAGLIVAAAALRALGRRTAPREDEDTATYLSHAVLGMQRMQRSILFAWLLCALQLTFLIPWWIDGYRMHRGDEALAVVSGWVPIALFAAFAVWTVRKYLRLRAEVARLGLLRDAIADS